jgi:hypothetical protein
MEGVRGRSVESSWPRGIDIDHGPVQPGTWQYAFSDNRIAEWGSRAGVDGHATRVWARCRPSCRQASEAPACPV